VKFSVSTNLVPKKPATKKPSPTRKKTRATAPADIVITSKAQATELQQALERRTKRQTLTQLIDHALPESLLFQGVIGAHSQHQQPLIQNGVHTPSPFILSLKLNQPSMEELIDERKRALRVNLLVGSDSQNTSMLTSPATSCSLPQTLWNTFKLPRT